LETWGITTTYKEANIINKLIGFTGTRKGLTSAQQNCLGAVIRLNAPDQIEAHHGLCGGADNSFHHLVAELYKEVDRKIVGHPPIDKKDYVHNACDEMRAAKDFLVRNHDIVDETEILIACPKGKESQRSGTWSAIRYAKSQRRPVTIIWPDGSVAEIDPNSKKGEAAITESQANEYKAKISGLFKDGVAEISMREVMNNLKANEKENDLRPSDEWFEANGFNVESRIVINKHPYYEIVRFFVRKAGVTNQLLLKGRLKI